jgi:hypothetical protein
MSTLAYNALTKKRQASPKVDDRTRTSVPGIKQYVDAAAALVPAEVLAFHVFALQITTKTVQSEGKGQVTGMVDEKITTAKGENVTVITDPGALKIVFIALVIAAAVLYAIGHLGTWTKADFWLSRHRCGQSWRRRGARSSCGGWRVIGPQLSITRASAASAE